MIPTLQLGQFGRAGKVANAVPPLALDIFTANLWGAYGLTKLLTSYAGSAIRVRKSTGGDTTTEQDIGFTGTALDTSSLATFAGSETVVVTKCYDQSGNGRDFAQATGSKQPRIVNAGVYDGFLRWDGTDDVMTAASGPTSTAISAAMKYDLRTTGQEGILWQSNFIAAHNMLVVQQESSDHKVHGYGTSGTSFVENNWPATVQTTGTDLFVFDRAQSGAARVARYRNGSLQTATNQSNTGSAANFTSETFFLGDDNGGGSPSSLQLFTLAIWSASQAANAAGIHTAIA